ncbi:WYL domain-containing protein [Runella sp. MFBS21]|uniref:helix-turn-helix transcriptional regulator n=1 Tax=Runella sp. MFBS21 TaxID=3034018 RepID=UPI0023F7AD07|nr:WYL domain-containing protein [Runella sp. MFBS21]MDF7816781.1 WYL domain-containing protein [Runella sp. MFBS21]
MTIAATLRRHLCIIRAVQPPFVYPSKEKLFELLREDGVLDYSESSFERDKKDITKEYGIYIKHNKRRNGYYINLNEDDEDITDFKAFVELLERRERLEFVKQTLTGLQEIGRYLQLEKNPHFAGIDHLPKLWEALRAQRVISFRYSAYAQTTTPVQTRLIEPGLLFEYKNRWYLDGWDINKKEVRTFGLDRMTLLQLTDKYISQNRSHEYRAMRRHVIGVNSAPDNEPVRVVLRLTALQANYLQSLPLHPSQRTLPQTSPDYVDFELRVVLNKELEIEILGMGEAVEVLEPAELRETIRKRIEATFQKYL